VLGDNNTAFAINGQQLVAFDVNSGAALWSWQPPQGHTVALLAASTGGGVVAADAGFDSNNTYGEQIVSFDAAGNPTYDSSMGPGVNGLDYWAFGEYLGATNVFQQIMSALPFQVPLTPSPRPGSNPSGNRGPNVARISTFIPVGQIDDRNPEQVTVSQFEATFKQDVPGIDLFSDHINGQDTSERFQKQIDDGSWNAMAFIGHSVFTTTPSGIISVGICFSDVCLEKQPAPGEPGYTNQPPGLTPSYGNLGWVTVPPPFGTKTRIVFIASCYASDNLRRWFAISNSTKGRVLIMSNNDQNGTGLLAAADAWRRIAKDLVNGLNVQTALANVNNDPHYKNDLNLQFIPTGDTSLCLHGSCGP